MAIIRIALVAALAVAAFADPLRYKRQHQALIASSGALAADGAGAAADHHDEAVVAIGIPASAGSGWGSGWGSDAGSPGVPASIVIGSVAHSLVNQEGNILEVTSNDGQGGLAGLQDIHVSQLAQGSDLTLDVLASGGDVVLVSDSGAEAAGEGASAAAGALEIIAN